MRCGIIRVNISSLREGDYKHRAARFGGVFNYFDSMGENVFTGTNGVSLARETVH